MALLRTVRGKCFGGQALLRAIRGWRFGGQARLNRTLASRLRALTGLDWRVAVARDPIPRDRLSPGELRTLGALAAPSRRADWLRGRAALKRLLAGADTSRLRFPNPRCSLAHAGGIAVAVSCRARGVGVDFEVRTPSGRAARRFLSPSEFRGAGGERGWLRLWTVKEACFKADLGNAGTAMTAYETETPAARKGVARRVATGARFRYASLGAFGGWLSVAVREEGVERSGERE